MLGDEADASCGKPSGTALEMDRALAALYDADGPGRGGSARVGGSGRGAPTVVRWLGDIRQYFPASVVQVMQKDALQRLRLNEMLLQPEMLEAVQPDVHLVASLVPLSRAIPAGKETARRVVRQVVDALMKRLEEPLRSAVTGALTAAPATAARATARSTGTAPSAPICATGSPSCAPSFRSGCTATAASRATQREVILCIDQSGSMAASVVYSSIFGAVLASLPAVSTKLVVFDTEVVDLSDQLDDPVELLFGVQLGGGTDIGRAVAYCRGLIRDPRNTIFVLISDPIEGGVEQRLLRAPPSWWLGRAVRGAAGAQRRGAPSYDRQIAAKLAGLGVPSFACTPDAFRPDGRGDPARGCGGWAAQQGW